MQALAPHKRSSDGFFALGIADWIISSKMKQLKMEIYFNKFLDKIIERPFSIFAEKIENFMAIHKEDLIILLISLKI